MATDGRTEEMSEETVFLQHYVELLQQEVDLLMDVLPFVEEVEWSASPAAHREVQDRMVKNTRVDPVGGAASDPKRLAIREQSRRSEAILKEALVGARGVRRGLERALRDWDSRAGGVS